MASMKEKLQLYKQAKSKGKAAKENVPVAAAAPALPVPASAPAPVSTAKPNYIPVAAKERKNVIKPLGPCTGVFQNVSVASTTQAFSSARKHAAAAAAVPRRAPTAAEIKQMLDEYQMLAQSAGVSVARSFIEAVPSEPHMKGVEGHAVYWLTWSRTEADAQEWDVLEGLLVRAKNAVASASGLQALATAETQVRLSMRLYTRISHSHSLPPLNLTPLTPSVIKHPAP